MTSASLSQHCTADTSINLSQSRAHVIANAELIVADLDQTLAATKHVHRALIGTYLEKLSSDIPGYDIDRAYSALRGKSYHDILSGMLGVLHFHQPEKMSLHDFTEGFFAFVRSYEPTHSALRAHEMPGARNLLRDIQCVGAPVIVCTGSPRPLAERFLAQTGLDEFVSLDRLFCWGDSAFSKADPEFWAHALGDTLRSRIVALDDHPHSAEMVLGIGGVGGMMLMPSAPNGSFERLSERFGTKVRYIADSWDNWS